MLIRSIDPANMKGLAGRRIEKLAAYMRDKDHRFSPAIPDFPSIVLLSAEADGIRIPKIGYIGSRSYIKLMMEGTYGLDAAAAIRRQDPQFDRAVATGYAEAAEGREVFELVEIAVTPPGSIRPLPVSYYRMICAISIGERKVLINLTLPTPEQLVFHQRALDTKYHWLC